MAIQKDNLQHLIDYLDAPDLPKQYALLDSDQRLIARYLVEIEHRSASEAIQHAFIFGRCYFITEQDKEEYAEWLDSYMHKCVNHVNRIYDYLGMAEGAGDTMAGEMLSEQYENLISEYSRTFGMDRNQFEDLCTDTRWLGWNID